MKTSVLKKLAKIIVERIPEEEIRDELIRCLEEYCYARVSTREQHADRQLVAMGDFGVEVGNIFLDKQSGKDFHRAAYRRLLKKISPGDTLVIKSIDRLGRDYGEILEQWWITTKEKQAAIVVLDIPLLDTRQKERDLTGMFIADLVLQILSYVAQTEREFIRQRQTEGISAAKVRGVKFGRPPKEQPALFAEVREAWERGEISAHEASRKLKVSRATFSALQNHQCRTTSPVYTFRWHCPGPYIVRYIYPAYLPASRSFFRF